MSEDIKRIVFYFISFACAYICAPYVPDACGGLERASDPLELGLYTVVNHHLGAEIEPRPLENQPVLLTAGPSLYALLLFLLFFILFL